MHEDAAGCAQLSSSLMSIANLPTDMAYCGYDTSLTSPIPKQALNALVCTLTFQSCQAQSKRRRSGCAQLCHQRMCQLPSLLAARQLERGVAETHKIKVHHNFRIFLPLNNVKMSIPRFGLRSHIPHLAISP